MKAAKVFCQIILLTVAAVPGTCECRIDGKAKPEAIPDDVAYRMVFNTVKRGPKESREDNERRVNAYMRLIGLGERDWVAFHSALTRLTFQSNEIEEKIHELMPQFVHGQAILPQVAVLLDQRLSLAPQMRKILGASLTEPGAAAMARHIAEYVKPRTVMSCPK